MRQQRGAPGAHGILARFDRSRPFIRRRCFRLLMPQIRDYPLVSADTCGMITVAEPFQSPRERNGILGEWSDGFTGGSKPPALVPRSGRPRPSRALVFQPPNPLYLELLRADVLIHEGNAMTRRQQAGMGAAFKWSIFRPSSPARRRLARPCLDHLESRRLLATVAEFPLPSGAGSAPDGVAVGSNGSIWFTAFGADAIGKVDPTTHAITEYTIPTKNAEPLGIALGPDGNLWFTEFNTDQIGMINATTHKFTEYPIPTMDAEPFGITAGPNNTVWFTEWSGNQIGSVNITTGKVTEYPIPTLDAAPEGIMQDAAGNIWFTESVGNKIAMYDPTTETYTEHALPNAVRRALRDHRRARRQPLFHGVHRQPDRRVQPEQFFVLDLGCDSKGSKRGDPRADWDRERSWRQPLVHREQYEPGGDAEHVEFCNHRSHGADRPLGPKRDCRWKRRIGLVRGAE